MVICHKQLSLIFLSGLRWQNNSSNAIDCHKSFGLAMIRALAE